MNAASNSPIEENGCESDSDANTDNSLEYYQPISAGHEQEDVADQTISDFNSDDEDDSGFHHLPNGYAHGIGNGISSLDLSDDEERKSNSDEEEEMRMREALDSAMQTAFREAESRRNAPLAPETATRVMEAMRGVSFSGFAPDWANGVSEDQWINQLRRLRRL